MVVAKIAKNVNILVLRSKDSFTPHTTIISFQQPVLQESGNGIKTAHGLKAG